MAKKGNLFLLVKSLSKAEKRYFKLFCQGKKAYENYWQLFREIDTQDVYDEAVLRKRLAGSSLGRQLPVAKHHLYHLLLKTLRNYYGKVSKAAEVRDGLRNVEILLDRELPELAEKELDRIHKIASRYELQVEGMAIHSLRRRLLLMQRPLPFTTLQQVLEEEKSLIQQLADQQRLWEITLSIFSIPPDDNSLLDEAVLSPDRPASLQGNTLKHHIYYTYHTIRGDSKLGSQWLEKLIALLEEQPHRIEDDPSPYITALNNYLSYHIFRKEYDQVDSILEKIHSIPNRYRLNIQRKVAVKYRLRTYNVELEMYRDTANYEKGRTLIEEIKGFLAAEKRTVPNDYFMQFWYQFAYIFFMSRDFNAALQWVNEILQSRFRQVRPDLESYARLLNLMIHFELGNYSVLRYAVVSTRRFLNKKGKMESFEKLLLQFFSKACNSPKAEHGALLQKLEADLAPVLNQQHLDYLNFIDWIRERRKFA